MALAQPLRKDAATRRALDLLRKVALIDGHNDLPWVIRSANGGDVAAYDLSVVHPESDTDLPRLKAGRVAVQVLAAFLPSEIAHPATVTLEQIDLVRRIETLHRDQILPIRRAADIGAAARAARIGSLISVEGTIGCEGSLVPLRVWHSLGVRLITLVHNASLPWVDSATDLPLSGGLSPFGRDLVAELNRLGIIIDLSHSAESSARAVLACSQAPVVLSHSNAAALCPHPRNASDALMAEVASKGGLIMATFVPEFINPDLWSRVAAAKRARWQGRPEAELAALERAVAEAGPLPTATLEQFCDHVCHMLKVAGPDHVGIGSDFFGGAQPVGLEDCSAYPALFAELIRRGISDSVLGRLAGANFIRVMRKVERISRDLQRVGGDAPGPQEAASAAPLAKRAAKVSVVPPRDGPASRRGAGPTYRKP